jgi:hypothetical protein
MKYARIVNNTVVETALTDPYKIFHPDLAKMFIECPDEVERHWSYDGETFTAPPEPEPVVEETANTVVEEANTATSNTA